MTDFVKKAVVSESTKILLLAIERFASFIPTGHFFCASYSLARMSW